MGLLLTSVRGCTTARIFVTTRSLSISATGRFPSGVPNLALPSANTYWQITYEPVRSLLRYWHVSIRLDATAQNAETGLRLVFGNEFGQQNIKAVRAINASARNCL